MVAFCLCYSLVMKQRPAQLLPVVIGGLGLLTLFYLYFFDQGDSLLTPGSNYGLLGLIAVSGAVGVKLSRSAKLKNISLVWLIFGLIGIGVSWYLSRLSFS
jgi:hypothetical protein